MAQGPEESIDGLKRELSAARDRVQDQIDKLRARPYPTAAMGPVGTLMFGMGAPFRANGVMIDNDQLIAKLTDTLREIEECLANLGNGDT
jgi:hypothetical protein